MSDLVKRLRIKAGMIEMGEMIAWGSDSALMREAADALEMAAPAVQGEPDVEALLNRIIPRIDAGGPNPIDPYIHCCEWTLHRERERIHAEFADALAAYRKGEES